MISRLFGSLSTVTLLATLGMPACGARVSIGELPDGGELPLDGGRGPAPSEDGGAAPDASDGESAWAPCAGKACGDYCFLCPPDSDCSETGDTKYCTSTGKCTGGEAPVCNDAGPPAYQPCAAKACGEGCTLCAPDGSGCAETPIAKQCNVMGICEAKVPDC